MKNRLKLLIPILLLTILFVVSFILQSKYNHVILDRTNGVDTEALFLKEIVVLGSSFAFLNVLIASIVICFVSMFVILIFVLLNRRKMERRARTKEKLNVVYQQLILDALEDKIVDKKEFKKFRKICNSRFRRNIFINQIIDVASVMPNEMQSKLRKLYFDLGLIKETRRKLRSRQWHHKIKAMKELSRLEITDYNKTIVKYVNAKNDTLRMEAQIAMVRLSDFKENPFLFLSYLKHDFSLWEQITLHQLMVEANMNVPDFGQWLDSKNESVVMFCLRMIREYNQINNAEKISHIIYHGSEPVRKLAIEIAGDLKLGELSDALKKKYKYEVYEIELEIVKSLGKIAEPKTVQFLQHVVDSENDTQLQIEAVKAIKNMGEIGETYLMKMLNSEYKDYNIIIKHVLDSRIN